MIHFFGNNVIAVKFDSPFPLPDTIEVVPKTYFASALSSTLTSMISQGCVLNTDAQYWHVAALGRVACALEDRFQHACWYYREKVFTGSWSLCSLFIDLRNIYKGNSNLTNAGCAIKQFVGFDCNTTSIWSCDLHISLSIQLGCKHLPFWFQGCHLQRRHDPCNARVLPNSFGKHQGLTGIFHTRFAQTQHLID